MSTKIHKMKNLSIIFLSLFLIISCKKDTPVDTCTNGFKDIGEENVDCGGNCKPCEKVVIPSLSLKLNNKPISFGTRSFTQENNLWSLKFSNDSIQVQIEVGNTIVTDSLYNVNSINTFASINGIVYPLTISHPTSNIGFLEYLTSEQLVSGLFQVKFYRNGFTDTMRMTSGEFRDISF